MPVLRYFALLSVGSLVFVFYFIIRGNFLMERLPKAFKKEHLGNNHHDGGKELTEFQNPLRYRDTTRSMRGKKVVKKKQSLRKRKNSKKSKRQRKEKINFILKKKIPAKRIILKKRKVNFIPKKKAPESTIEPLQFLTSPKKMFFDKTKSDIYGEWILSSSSLKIKTSLSGKLIKNNQKPKTILIYTSLFKEEEWPNLREGQGKDYLKRHKCPVDNCMLSYDRNELLKSDIVVFHARDIINSQELRDISDSERPTNQIWVYFSSESPSQSINDAMLDNVFDWTMTYHHNSDIWLPYARYYPKQITEDSAPVNFAKTKKKLIAWLVSNCGLMRDGVVHELEAYLSTEVAGKCANDFSKTFLCGTNEDCDEKISEYKFYLSFESKHCDDYVTEKYWYRAIRNNVVPIVLGAGPYNDPKAAIPGSYINVLDFDNISELIKYIKYLDKNDTAYNEYFKWKDKYQLWQPVCDWPFEPYWACEMCVRLNNGVERKSRRLSEFWGAERNCEGRAAKLTQFLERSGHDFTKDSPQGPEKHLDNNIVQEVKYEDVEEDQSSIITTQPYQLEIAKILRSSDVDYKNFTIPCIFLISLIATLYYFVKLYYS